MQLGIRPEHAVLKVPGQGPFDMQIEIIEELGAARLCSLKAEDIPFSLLTWDRPALTVGATVGVAFNSA
jgi:ABC-type sugar transport system ATPase subunit